MKLDIVLNDSEGKSPEIGDEIIVTLPEIDVPAYSEHDEEGFYAPERVVVGAIKLFLSKGLYLKITGIIKDDENWHHVGQQIKFKFQKWHWEVMPSK